MSDADSVVAIIPAAGSGSRMGLPRSKALLSAGGALTIVQRTVHTVCSDPRIQHVVIVGRGSDLSELQTMHFGDVPYSIIEGGATRQESVRRAIEYIDTSSLTPDLVLVHDAARCLLSPQLVSRCIDAAFLHGAVTAAIPAVDTLVESGDDATISRVLDRSRIWMVQTPQVFRFDLLKEAHRIGEPGATDDATLVRALHPVHIVEGEGGNRKITTRGDYDSLTRSLA